jgi:hypothetical protein
MEPLDSGSVRELAAERTGPCVSIYVATPPGREVHQGRVRLEQLLGAAEAELVAAAVPPPRIAELLAPARALLAQPWRPGPGEMLGVFAAPGFARVVRGKLQGAEGVVVGDRFNLRPLLALLAAPARFYVLAVSLDQVRLIEATPGGPRRLPLGELERGFVEAMGYVQFDSGLQLHSAGGSGGGAALRPAVLHGHGDRDEERLEEDLRHWFRRIADAVAARALDRSAPRVLATTQDHVSAYLAASRDRLVIPEALVGNPDRSTDGELVSRARPLVEAALARQREEALARWRELLGSERATGDVATALRLARQGRVQALFLAAGTELWGSFEAATGHLELHAERRPGDEELLGRAALEALAGGGEVYEVGDAAGLQGAPLAALLRT